MIGRFVDAHINSLTPEQLGRLESLLEEQDYDLLGWAAGILPIPERLDHDVMHLLTDYERYMPR